MSSIEYFTDARIIVLCFILVGTAAVIYLKFIRQFFTIKVTCWFCSSQTQVPYGNQNCWDCVECEQYNGFTKDGDYNKPIPAQYDEDLNHPIGCKRKEFLTRGEVLCAQCSENEYTKIKQLANYQPFDEKNVDGEFSFLKRYVDNQYKLCTTCEQKVEQIIHEQHEIIKGGLNDSLRSQLIDLQEDRDNITVSPFLNTSNTIRIAMSYFFHVIEVATSLGLAIRQIQLDAEQTGTLRAYFPQLSSLHPLLFTLDRYSLHLVVGLILSGIIAKVLVTKERFFKIDLLNSVFLLLVLFTQADFLTMCGTGSLLEATIYAGCFITSVLCLVTKRKQNNPVFVLKPRRQNNSYIDDDTSTYDSSVNQSTFSNECQINRTSHEAQVDSMVELHKDDDLSLKLSYTVFKMDLFNIGSYEPSFSGQWTRSRSNSISSQQSSRSSYAEVLSSQETSEVRKRNTNSPLIFPSCFSPSSNHIQRPGTPSSFPGLFEPPYPDQVKQKHTSSSFSTFTSRRYSQMKLFSQTQTTPQVVTRFGAPPFSLPPISNLKGLELNGCSSSLCRSNSFKCLQEKNKVFDDDISDSDSFEEESDSSS